MSDLKYTIKNEVFFEQIINKSRFICYLFPVSSLDEIKEQLLNIRKKHYDATHNCYAYIIDNTAKSSDDGEPSQTAGVVIYEVLKKNDLTNILAIVTRYYGGIKLGAGGLIRAYGSSTAEAINLAEKVLIEKLSILQITLSYSYLNQINKLIEDYEIINRSFKENVVINFIVPEREKENLRENLINHTNNDIEIKELDFSSQQSKTPS